MASLSVIFLGLSGLSFDGEDGEGRRKKNSPKYLLQKIIELAGFEPTHLRYEPWPVTSELTRMLTGLILLLFKDKVSKS